MIFLDGEHERQPAPPEEIECANCGKWVEHTATVCPSCGIHIAPQLLDYEKVDLEYDYEQPPGRHILLYRPGSIECPKCKSVDIDEGTRLARGLLRAVYGVKIPTKSYKCQKCGYKWSAEGEQKKAVSLLPENWTKYSIYFQEEEKEEPIAEPVVEPAQPPAKKTAPQMEKEAPVSTAPTPPPIRLIDCPACGHKVSNYARACPSCGHPIADMPQVAVPSTPAPAPAIPTPRPTTPRCPTCGSTDIKKLDSLDRTISATFWGLGSGKIGKQFKCRHCGYMW